MASYKISGTRPVAGKQPGETLTDEELDGCNIGALLEGGHLTPATTTKTVKVVKQEEQ